MTPGFYYIGLINVLYLVHANGDYEFYDSSLEWKSSVRRSSDLREQWNARLEYLGKLK